MTDNASQANPADNAAPLLDEQIIANLQALTSPGESDFLKELTDVFFARSPGVIDQIAQSVQAEDPIGYQRASHSLKGSAANIGALSLAAVCTKMEAAGKDKDLSAAPTDLAHVKTLYDQVKTALEQKLIKKAS